MTQSSIERQNVIWLRQKVKRALYEKKYLKKLVDNITELVDTLIELFLASQAKQGSYETQASEINSVTPELMEITGKQENNSIHASIDKFFNSPIP
ncbi:hypothetical protein CC78DRAFT_531130 [Lojkania enalia]|uniref:Prion-inhibition and propagation HeLo domain-containing protein n=1 Tax=Lojkania enalia TaxID=147567 RepID=A0A9P4N7Q1_9PLEO|nr:hypothetical protein CC78DRAFT_531130 [Didymosphaeria enalia]